MYKQDKPTELTIKNLRAYDWIRAYMAENNGRSPSIREIMKGLGLRSPAPVQAHLTRLREAGYIAWPDGQARALRLLHEPAKTVKPADVEHIALRLEQLAKRSPIKVRQELLAIAQQLQTA